MRYGKDRLIFEKSDSRVKTLGDRRGSAHVRQFCEEPPHPPDASDFSLPL